MTPYLESVADESERLERRKAETARWADVPRCHVGTLGCRDTSDGPHECPRTCPRCGARLAYWMVAMDCRCKGVAP